MQKSPLCPITLGSKVLPLNIFYAPLAGCSDFPFRKLVAEFKPGLMFCEMVKMEALIKRIPATLQMLDYSEEMHPIGAQLCGSNPKIAGEAASIIEEMGFDVVDLNCGCPVDKVTKDGSGSGMLKDLGRIGETISNMVAKVKIPVTVKIRAGWDDTTLVVPEVVSVVEEAGASLITIHGRTREQGYQGPANWDWITCCKKAAKSIKVFGNGDVFTKEAAFSMFEKTGCDGVLVSRGTLGTPWIVDEIRALSQGIELAPRSFDDRKDALLRHFELVVSYYGERKSLLVMRHIGCWYIKNSYGSRKIRHAISNAETLDDVRRIISEMREDEEAPTEVIPCV